MKILRRPGIATALIIVSSATLAAQGTAPASGPIIQTYAGADWTFQASGKPALNAPFGEVRGLALDSAGSLYIADPQNYQVYRVGADGIINIFAGNGFDAPAPDGVAARNATLNQPHSVVVGPDGSVYIAENFDIVRVDPNGIIHAFAGGFGTFGGDGGPASKAGIYVPRGMVFDAAGNLYFSDSVNHRVRRIDPNGIITTVAGNGQAGSQGDGGLATSATIANPMGLRFDRAGNLYIADADSNNIRRVTPSGTISTFASKLNSPEAIDFDASGNAYIADTNSQHIFKITPSGSMSTFAGTGVGGFSGDGSGAISAALFDPADVLVDRSGNILIADSLNRRVRRIDTGGNIATIAGNGLYRFSPEGTPATLAFLTGPIRVAVSPGGLVYITDGDAVTRRIVRVESDGRLTTVVGKGTPNFGGNPDGMVFDSKGNLFFSDGGIVQRLNSDGSLTRYAGGGSDLSDGIPATSASLSPSGLAMDAGGNLYIADVFHDRIRKVTTSGTITTIAGSGVTGFLDGPAAKAQFSGPYGVAVDAAGNVFVADQNNNRIRKIGTDGVVSTILGPGVTSTTCNSVHDLAFDATGALLAVCTFNFDVVRIANGAATVLVGDGKIAFAGDGGPAILASLNNPEGIAVDAKGNLYIADLSNFRVRIVSTVVPTLSVSPATVSFTVRAGDAPPIPQPLTVNGSIAGLPFSVTASDPFLLPAPLAGVTPATAYVTVFPPALSPGTYTGTVQLTSGVAGVPPAIVTVNVTVLPPLPALLSVDPPGLSFAFVRGAAAADRKVLVRNTGGGSASFAVAAKTNNGGSWLTVSPTSGTASGTSPVSLNVTADPAKLAVSTYTGSITVTPADGSQPIVVPVTVTISNSGQLIRLSQTGLTFLAVQNGGATPAQNIFVLSPGQGSFTFTTNTITAAGIPKWLSVTPSSDSASSTQGPVALAVSVNPSGLAPGDYFGRLQVISQGVDNSPQEATIVLSVLPAGTDPGPSVQPAGLIFTAVAGRADPPSQTVTVSNLTPGPISFGSGAATLDGGRYFLYQPSSASISTGSLQLVVQPGLGGLAAGTYRGAITLVFSNGSIRTIAILIVIAPPGTSSGASARDAKACPTQLLPLITSLGQNSNVLASYPAGVTVKVVDDCGNPHTTGSVVASFSNGDPPIALLPLGDGQWTGSWQSGHAAPQVTITADAENPLLQIKGTVSTTVGLTGNANPPVVVQGSVLSASSFALQSPLAPGALVSIYGSRLSNSSQQAPSLPLDTQLGGTQVLVAGQQSPLLFSSDGQVNAVLPLGTPLNTPAQVIVIRGNQYSVPVEVSIAAAVPGIFTTAGNGRGQGHVYVAQADGTLKLAGPGNAAKTGDTLVMYCSGLGSVDFAVTDGGAAPLDRAVRTSNAVTVNVGGASVPAAFAGLSPGFAVGLYQVNFVVPGGIAAGSSVPVSVTAAGQTSPAVTIAVQ